jgi:hypothetical protein
MASSGDWILMIERRKETSANPYRTRTFGRFAAFLAQNLQTLTSEIHRNIQPQATDGNKLRRCKLEQDFGSDGWNRTIDLGVMNPTL